MTVNEAASAFAAPDGSLGFVPTSAAVLRVPYSVLEWTRIVDRPNYNRVVLALSAAARDAADDLAVLQAAALSTGEEHWADEDPQDVADRGDVTQGLLDAQMRTVDEHD